jgi:outer membrane lipoprotein-sorting protein
MKLKIFAGIVCLGLLAQSHAQSGSAKSSTPAKSEQNSAQISPAGPQDLKNVIAQMNQASKTFKTAQADFQWDQYQKVVDETDVQKGQMFLKRTSKGMDAALRITSPDQKQVLFKNGKLQFYQPKIDQVTERDASQNRSDIESFMSLGFGGSGDDLLKNYDVKMTGWEQLDGVKTAKLELVPKSEKIKASLSQVLLWLDPARDVSIKQQFLQPSQDYRLARYTNIKINGSLPGDVFKLKTTSKTTFVKPE